ncbi:hypothetical protein GGI12_000227 [Dipsacomyces acuminosporus]|nr:hypothetical protein GGI12_000227 [Dipsacomyces acuminosporus]
MLGQNLARILRGPSSQYYRVKLDGLFGGSKVQHGNNKPKSLHKTRRIWMPNIQKVNLYSAILDRTFNLRVTTRVLRTIDKKGGLDNYLLLTKDKNIASDAGVEIKQSLQKTLAAQEKTAAS